MTSPSDKFKSTPSALPESLERLLTQRAKPTQLNIQHTTRTRSTADNLLETLDILSETARVQAKHSQGTGELDARLVRSVKELSVSWAAVQGEMRSNIQALTDEDYLRLLEQIHMARGVPLPLGVSRGDVSALQLQTNFQKTETESSSLDPHSPTPEPVNPELMFEEASLPLVPTQDWGKLAEKARDKSIAEVAQERAEVRAAPVPAHKNIHPTIKRKPKLDFNALEQVASGPKKEEPNE